MGNLLYVWKLDPTTRTARIFDIIPNQSDDLNGVRYAFKVGLIPSGLINCEYRTSNDRYHNWYN